MPESESNIIFYNTIDGKAPFALYAKNGKILLNPKRWRYFLSPRLPM